jgi:hypothetical protein
LRIGIVTPAFNAARCVGEAVRSVLAQGHADWRMVVVDDGSTDATAAIVAAISDTRLGLIRQANFGVSAARNRGIGVLNVDAYLFLDADDRLAPEALSALAVALERHSCAVAAIGSYQFTAGTGPALRARRPLEGDLLDALLLRNRFVNGGHVLVRATAVHAAGGFDAGLRYGEDWEFWVRIALQGKFVGARSGRPLLHVSQHANGAYARFAADPASFEPCMAAIFDSPAVISRVGPERVSALRRLATAENHWVVGRELIRHGCRFEGLAWLCRALWLCPSLRRGILLTVVPAVLCLPTAMRGALRPYAPARMALQDGGGHRDLVVSEPEASERIHHE